MNFTNLIQLSILYLVEIFDPARQIRQKTMSVNRYPLVTLLLPCCFITQASAIFVSLNCPPNITDVIRAAKYNVAAGAGSFSLGGDDQYVPLARTLDSRYEAYLNSFFHTSIQQDNYARCKSVQSLPFLAPECRITHRVVGHTPNDLIISDWANA